MKFSLGQLKSALESVVQPHGRVFLVHSGLWTFGHRLKVPPEEQPQAILQTILDIIGPNSTLLLPTFTYSTFPKTRLFNLIETKSETGNLGEELLKKPEAIRTISSMESFAVIGPESKTLENMIGKTEWGEGSTWEWLEMINGRIIGLGFPIHVCASIIHRAEEIFQVPYRYYKSFKGFWSDGKELQKPWVSNNFVRGLVAKTNHLPVEKRLSEKRQLQRASLDGITIHSALSKDIVEATLEVLRKDPLALVVNVEDVREWLERGKEAEIAGLKPEEKFLP